MADGHWKVNMSQSIPIDKVVTAPGTISGHGCDVVLWNLKKVWKNCMVYIRMVKVIL